MSGLEPLEKKLNALLWKMLASMAVLIAVHLVAICLYPGTRLDRSVDRVEAIEAAVANLPR